MDNISLNMHVKPLLNDCYGQATTYFSRKSIDKIEININIDKKSMSVRDIAVIETNKQGVSTTKSHKTLTSTGETPFLEYLEYTVNDVSDIDVDNRGECSICFNHFNTEEHKKRCLLSCRHSFCELCLKEVLEEQSVCPLCQTEVLHRKYTSTSHYSQSI